MNTLLDIKCFFSQNFKKMIVNYDLSFLFLQFIKAKSITALNHENNEKDVDQWMWDGYFLGIYLFVTFSKAFDHNNCNCKIQNVLPSSFKGRKLMREFNFVEDDFFIFFAKTFSCENCENLCCQQIFDKLC